MAFVVYLLTRVLGWLLRLDRSDHASELEILVLRHQLKVLRRTKPCPPLSGIHRAVLLAFSRMLPRERWASFLRQLRQAHEVRRRQVGQYRHLPEEQGRIRLSIALGRNLTPGMPPGCL